MNSKKYFLRAVGTSLSANLAKPKDSKRVTSLSWLGGWLAKGCTAQQHGTSPAGPLVQASPHNSGLVSRLEHGRIAAGGAYNARDGEIIEGAPR